MKKTTRRWIELVFLLIILILSLETLYSLAWWGPDNEDIRQIEIYHPETYATELWETIGNTFSHPDARYSARYHRSALFHALTIAFFAFLLSRDSWWRTGLVTLYLTVFIIIRPVLLWEKGGLCCHLPNHHDIHIIWMNHLYLMTIVILLYFLQLMLKGKSTRTFGIMILLFTALMLVAQFTYLYLSITRPTYLYLDGNILTFLLDILIAVATWKYLFQKKKLTPIAV